MRSSRPQFDSAIADYYAAFDEESRLQSGAFLLEGLRTRELLERHLPAPPATVLDVGGGAGAYAFWLAQRGYTVHLVDPVTRHIEQAQQRNAASATPLASCTVGDARAITFSDSFADVVLLLGPLYHLTEAEDRVHALQQARRVLKPGGLLFASAISRLASTLDGLLHDAFTDPAFVAIAEQDLRDGQHRNNTGRTEYFTTAYFHRPEDLRAEAQSSGLEVLGVFGIEGPGGILPDIAARLADPQRRENVLRAARMLEADPAILAVSSHLLAVARKPA